MHRHSHSPPLRFPRFIPQSQYHAKRGHEIKHHLSLSAMICGKQTHLSTTQRSSDLIVAAAVMCSNCRCKQKRDILSYQEISVVSKCGAPLNLLFYIVFLYYNFKIIH